MKTTYQYQFYPNTNHKQELNYWLRISRYWYDRQLGDLFDWWEMNGTAVNYCPPISSLGPVMESPNYYRQKQQLPIGKQDSVKVVAFKIVLFKILRIVSSGEMLDFTRVDSTLLQKVDRGIKRTFEEFFAGEIEGKKSGKHRLKTVVDFRTKTFVTAIKNWIKLIHKHWNYIRLRQLGIVEARVQESIFDGVKVKPISASKKVDLWYGKLCLEDSTIPNSIPDRVTAKWNNSLGLEAFLHQKEEIFTDARIKKYWDEEHSLTVDRDCNASINAINLKRLGLGILPGIKHPSGNFSLVVTIDSSTAKEILHTLLSVYQKPTPYLKGCVGVCH